jgi:hypothetical protein
MDFGQPYQEQAPGSQKSAKILPLTNESTRQPESSPTNASVHASDHDPPTSRKQPPTRHKESVSDVSEALARGQLSPGATDRVFPIRSVVTVDPNSNPAPRQIQAEGYFYNYARASEARRQSSSTEGSFQQGPSSSRRETSAETPRAEVPVSHYSSRRENNLRQNPPRLPPQIFNDIVSTSESEQTADRSERPMSEGGASSIRSAVSVQSEDVGIITARFKHVVTAEGHAVITGTS